jgi:CheY-like chemotaxis protein
MKPKILLIEDDKPTIELYEEIFKISGFEIETLDFGQKAIERLKEIREGKKEKPDLILLDLILPDMNGILVLEEAKKYPETKDLRFLALTNYLDPELNQELVKKGIEKILAKTNFTPSQLVEIVKSALGK